MQQSYGSLIPPSMIPTSATTRLSRSSTSSSGRYYPRSSFGSSSSNTSGRSRSISATYQRADKVTASKALFAKRASTGSYYSLLRKAVGRSTVPTDDDGYMADFEEHHAFDAVDTLKMRFNRSPKTPSTLRALRIIEQRTGTPNTASIDISDITVARSEGKRKERSASVEDWSDDYDIPETAECIVRSDSPKHISAFPSNQGLVFTDIDAIMEEAMREGLKYEPLVAPVDAISNITDRFLSRGGFTRGSSPQDVSGNHTQDDSVDIEEMMAEHADFANATQLLNKTDNLDFSTTSFQVWRDVPSSLSIESFSNSLILAPTAKIDNTPYVRAPLQPKTLVRRTPSKLRHEIEVISPEETIEVNVPEIVLHDPDAFPGHIFETYPSGAPTLPIWVDSVSFYTALEGPSEGDLVDLGNQCLVEETHGHRGDSTSTAASLANHIPPLPTSPDLLPVSDSDLKSCTDSLKLDGSSPKLQNDRSPEYAGISASNSIPISLFASSLQHHQLEVTRMTSPIVYSESVSFSCGAGSVATSPAQDISAFVFPTRLPRLQQGWTGADLDVGVITQLGVSEMRHLIDGQGDPTAPAPWFQVSEPVVTGIGLGMSIPQSSLAVSDFPSIESLVSLPDFYEFSKSVPVVVLEQPPTAQPIFSDGNNVEPLDELDFEDALLRSLPTPVTKLSAEEARDWSRTVEVCIITPSSTMMVDARHDVASIFAPSLAPSIMDKNPPDDGEIFAVGKVAGLRETREREEDFILPAPLPVNDIPNFAALFSEDVPPGPRDFVWRPADVQVGRVENAPLGDHQNGLPPSTSVGLGIVDTNNTALGSSTFTAEYALPCHPGTSMISALQINGIALVVQEPLHVSASPRAAILDFIMTGAPNMYNSCLSFPSAVSVLQRQLHEEEPPKRSATRDNCYTRRRVSAIERWRQACAKAEVLSPSMGVDVLGFPHPVKSLPASSAILPNLHRSLSSPPLTQQYSSLRAVTQAAQAPVSRAQSLVLSQTTYRDLHSRKTNGCAYKRRSKKIRSSPKASFMSKASSIPTALRGNTSNTASKEKTGVASPSLTPLAVPISCFVEGFGNSVVASPSAREGHLGDGRQQNVDVSISSVETPPQSPSSCHNRDITTSEGWESGGMSFWGSPYTRKRSKLRHLFKRSDLPEGYVDASATPSSGPANLGNPSVSRNKSRRLWFDMNHHHHDRLFSPPRDNTPTSPTHASAATPALKSSKRMGLNFNWIARSRASVLGTPSSNAAAGRSSDTMPMPLVKPKGGRLEAVVYRLQSLL